jgi:hypothetical protein
VIDGNTRELHRISVIIDTVDKELTAQNHDTLIAPVEDKCICTKPGACPVQGMNGLQTEVVIARTPMNYRAESNQSVEDASRELNHVRNERSTYLVAENDVHVVPRHIVSSNPTTENEYHWTIKSTQSTGCACFYYSCCSL